MKEETKENIINKNTWIRIFFIIVFTICLSIGCILLGATIIFQVIVVLITGNTNNQILTFNKQLSLYIYDILLFVTFNNETKPFPFSDWPSENN